MTEKLGLGRLDGDLLQFGFGKKMIALKCASVKLPIPCLAEIPGRIRSTGTKNLVTLFIARKRSNTIHHRAIFENALV
jgi:hypothetical protein